MGIRRRARVRARIKNNTLTVRPDEKGLFVKADLGGTDIGRGLYQEIKGGYTDQMSFGFVVEEDEKEVDKDVEAVLRKAKERTEEYEAEKKARMRKARLPPNERDW